jgi:DNA polymerase III subunit gamma/tau
MVSMSTHVSEESLQFLFDMAFKTAGDVAKSSDPQIVLEMGLLRMVQAPKLVDLKKLLSGQAMALPASHPAKSSATTAKTIPLAGNPAPQSITQTSTVPQKFLKAKSPAEKWLLFVNSIRSRDAIFAAKVENFLFVSEENRILKLSISAKHMFLADTLKEPESRLKLQSFLDSLWGEDYTFQVVAAQKAEAAESAQKMAQKKAAVDEKNVEEQLKNHPSVQAAQKVFKGDVKAVPDRNRR